MIKKVFLIGLIGVGIGILVYFCFGVIPVVSTLQPLFTRAQAAWATIPDTIRGIILLGIPTAFATFFAWTKTRAMNKLQQTQQEAAQQIIQVEGEKRELEGQVKSFTEQGQTVGKTFTGEIKDLATELQSTKTTLNEKVIEIADWETKQEVWDQTRHRLEEDRRALNRKVEILEYERDVALGKIKPPVP